jgi:4-hydroxy-2-oxoheptanedioate aldolase
MNRVKNVIADGGIALEGMPGTFQGPTMVELMGAAGYDAVLIDLEHGGFDLEHVQVHVLAAEVAGVTPLVRIPGLDAPLITRLLDIGAQGIQLSGVQSAAHARALVDAVRYPPRGSRGLILNSRAMRRRGPPTPSVLEEADRDVLVKVTIESVAALDAVEEIAAIDGIDLIGIGPNDLSAALGVFGQPDSPVLADAVERVVEAARSGGRRRLSMSTGHPSYPRTPAQLAELDVAFVPCQPFPERRLLESFTEQVKTFRAGLPVG